MSTLPIFIFILNLFQGILYGLQVKFLPITLRSKGLSLSFIGALNLLALPWIFKSLWAPVVDFYWTTRSWLTISLTGILTCSFLVHLTQESTIFTLVIVILNIFSATHELVIGKIMLRQLQDEQLKTASSYKVFAYKAGSLLGGGATIWISSILALTDQVFLIISALYLALLMFAIFLIPNNFFIQPEVVKTRDTQMASPAVPEVKVDKSRLPGAKMFVNIMSRSSKWMVTSLLLYKFASHSSHMSFTMALVDKRVMVSNIGLMSGVIGHVISLMVALVMGIMLSQKRFSSMSILLCVSSLDVISVLLQISIVFSQSTTSVSTNIVFLSYCLQHMVLGAQAIPVFSIMLVFCQREPPKYQTTLHSLYSTLDTVGSKLSLFVSGLMADVFGYTFGLCVSFLVSIAVVFLVLKGPAEHEIERQHAKIE